MEERFISFQEGEAFKIIDRKARRVFLQDKDINRLIIKAVKEINNKI